MSLFLLSMFAFLTAATGAFFAALKTNKQRRIGFIFYNIGNISWFVFGLFTGQLAIVLQAVVFFIAATIGYINNNENS